MTEAEVVPVTRSNVPGPLEQQMDMCRALSTADLLPPHYRNKPANLFMALQVAQGLDIPVWAAIQDLYVISGKVGMSAALMRSLILRAGHRIRIVPDETGVTVTVIRRDDPDYEHTGRFTMEDARQAGLSGTNWDRYPTAMLTARATAIVARNACADVLAGVNYTAEEIGGPVLAPDLEA